MPGCRLRCRQLAAGYWPCSPVVPYLKLLDVTAGGSDRSWTLGSCGIPSAVSQPDRAVSREQPSALPARASSGSTLLTGFGRRTDLIVVISTIYLYALCRVGECLGARNLPLFRAGNAICYGTLAYACIPQRCVSIAGGR
jgi:hypothetical protein